MLKLYKGRDSMIQWLSRLPLKAECREKGERLMIINTKELFWGRKHFCTKWGLHSAIPRHLWKHLHIYLRTNSALLKLWAMMLGDM